MLHGYTGGREIKMGNHEYCTECELNDFHYGQPCPEWALKAARKRRAKVEASNKKRNDKLKRIYQKLLSEGYPVKLEATSIVISQWDLD